MGTIAVSENLSIDGGFRDPTGEEGRGVGPWFDRLSQGDGGAWSKVAFKDRDAWVEVTLKEAQQAEALLLGRESYGFFAARWPSRKGPFGDRLNALPKYVVSSTLESAAWNNCQILRGPVVDEVSKLKNRLGGELVVYASCRLVQTLMEADLVDELRLMVFPLVLGDGEHFFGRTSQLRPMRLVQARTVGEQLAHLVYRRVRT